MKKKIHPYYYLGGTAGLILGYLLSKIYQIWAIAYRQTNYDPNMAYSWPLWETATEAPAKFTFWVVFVYIAIGVGFVKVLMTVKRGGNGGNPTI
ncbi:hypothetical protein [Paenibacillus gansuensis]|uniref:Uncharacterized protein n=1 Tax=Paenibacillus gansuensis TaxID=306542 RepID=A0ABW5PKY0_9BACL